MNAVLFLASLLILHMDMNSIQMKKESVIEHLRMAADVGYNAILWEVEDKVQWETCPECVSPGAFTKTKFREILAEADRLGLEPIPLLQTFAHAEYVLAQEKHRGWREVPENPTCYCVSNPEVREFQKRFIREYLDLFGPKVRHFHLGADEAHVFGTCTLCSRKGKLELFVEHLNVVADVLRERGVKPGIWCDMMLTGDLTAEEIEEQVDRFPKDITAWYWDYYYGNSGENPSFWADRIRYLTKKGFPVIFASASASCGDGPFLPLFRKHYKNVSAGAAMARDRGLMGLCVTSWSVHLSPKYLQYPVWELAAKCFLNPGESVEKDLLEILHRRLGPVDIQTLADLSEWDSRLAHFDSRFGTYAAKWARPEPMGTWKEKIGRVSHENADYVCPSGAEIRSGLAVVSAALGKLRLLPTDARLAPYVEAARMSIAHREAIAAVLDGRPVRKIPTDDTVEFYRLEQEAVSASNCSSIVWNLIGKCCERKGARTGHD